MEFPLAPLWAKKDPGRRHFVYAACRWGSDNATFRETATMTIPALAKIQRSLLALLIAAATTAAIAQESTHAQTAPQEQQQQPQRRGGGAAAAQERPAQEPSVLRLLPADSVTEHTIDTPSGKLDYTATAGTLSLFDQSGARSAAIFYTAYVVK